MKMLTTLSAMLAFGTALAADAPPASEWRTLSGDQAREFWRGWKSEEFPAGWRVDGDTLSKDGDVDDLVSREAFGDFEIEFEWKLTPGGNAGFFYRGTREYDHIYWSAPEYQLLDDATRCTRTGATDSPPQLPPMRSMRRRPASSRQAASGTRRESSSTGRASNTG